MKLSLGVVGVLVINKEDGKILVLLRNKRDPEGNTWCLVGGKIDKGENKTVSAIREFKEETGIVINSADLEFIKTYTWKRKNINLIFNLFKLETETRFDSILLPVNEIDNYMWEKPEGLYKRKDLTIGLYEILKDYFNL